jgi:hypothetical protein
MWPFKDHMQEIARLRTTVAGMDAHLAAVHLEVEQLFLRMAKEDRDMVVTQLRIFVADSSHEPTQWITDPQDKRKFKSTLKGVLQLFIERGRIQQYP